MSADVVKEKAGPGCASFGCLVKTPLGCLSFLFGASVVVVFLLPAAFGKLVGPSWEREFDRAHVGSLAFGEFRFAWFGRQAIEGGTLREPGGFPVASFELSLPPMVDVVDSLGRGEIGPVAVELFANLELGADGRWNLGRALEARGASVEPAEPRFHTGTFELDTDYTFQPISGTITCRRAATGSELELRIRGGNLLVLKDAPHLVSLSGTLSGGGEVELEGSFDGLHELLAGEPTPLDWSLRATELPTAVPAALFAPALLLPDALGERITELRIEYRRAGSAESAPRLDVAIDGVHVQVRLAGVFADGVLSSEAGVEGEVSASAGTIEAPLDSFWSELVRGLLPLLDLREKEIFPDLVMIGGTADLVTIEVLSVELPLDGDLERLSAELVLTTGTGLAVLPGVLDEIDPAWGGAGQDAPFRLRVADGVVTYESVALRVGEERFELSGTYDLARDELDATLRGPARLLEPGAEGTGAVQVTGSRDDLRTRALPE